MKLKLRRKEGERGRELTRMPRVTHRGARRSPGWNGFSREHCCEVFTESITSSLEWSSYGHWPNVLTSHRDTPKDLRGLNISKQRVKHS